MAGSPAVRFEVERLEDVRRALRAAGIDYGELKATGLRAAKIVENAARPAAPVLSGALVGTLRSAGQAKGAVVRLGYASLPYAGPIHFGWRAHGIEPQPFIYDAADDNADEVRETYEQGLDDITKTLNR